MFILILVHFHYIFYLHVRTQLHIDMTFSKGSERTFHDFESLQVDFSISFNNPKRKTCVSRLSTINQIHELHAQKDKPA